MSTSFWDMAERMFELARRKNLGYYLASVPPPDWCFYLPAWVWDEVRGMDGAPSTAPTGPSIYRLMGLPFAIDPALDPDAIRLVRAWPSH